MSQDRYYIQDGVGELGDYIQIRDRQTGKEVHGRHYIDNNRGRKKAEFVLGQLNGGSMTTKEAWITTAEASQIMTEAGHHRDATTLSAWVTTGRLKGKSNGGMRWKISKDSVLSAIADMDAGKTPPKEKYLPQPQMRHAPRKMKPTTADPVQPQERFTSEELLWLVYLLKDNPKMRNVVRICSQELEYREGR